MTRLTIPLLGRLYLGHRVFWREPAAQDQTYFGVELGRLFVGFVITKDGGEDDAR